MPTFAYKAKTAQAETVSGQVAADHRDDAVEKIHQMGLLPVSVEELGKSRVTPSSGVGSGRVRVRELYAFSRQLINLSKAGIPIIRALDLLAGQTKNEYFRRVIETVRVGVKDGRSFSECLAEFPQVFSPLYITMVRAGEESGQLKETVMDVAQYLRRQDEIASKIRSALAYPLVMALFGVGTVIFILTYVMPQITELFVNLKQKLPGPTLWVMRISDFLIQGWIWLALGVFFLSVAMGNWLKTKNGRQAISHLKLKLPLLGNFFLKVELARFCRTLSLLIKSGVPIVQALKIATPVMENELIRKQLRQAHSDLVTGKSFSEALKGAQFIPPLVIDLINVGEHSGMLAPTLADIAEEFEQESEETIKIMMTLLEPLMIVVVGGVVGFIVVAMLLPIFELDVFAR